ncbi:Zn(II)2Cys6 transcription factor domain-containing protein [Sporobolomyces salmoneus]|uniref:Zn(II)2Cys6 transcription factor domain-containing protein n=1 Tax=Sporobolomyces salmoneus TaxID=183962 RepID=UPI00317F9883
MIPYYPYSPGDTNDTASTSSTSAYFPTIVERPPSAQISAHPYDSLSSLTSTNPHIPFDSTIYSQSVPNTPYPDPLQRHHLVSPPLRSHPLSYPPHLYQTDSVHDHTSSLIRFDQAPILPSDSNANFRRKEAPDSTCPPPPLPPPTRPSSASRYRDTLEDDDDQEAGSDRKLRGKRGRRSVSTAQSEPGRTTAHSLPESAGSESPNVEKADKSCKACRLRKVRCSRDWPRCVRCSEKTIECSYGDLIPASFLQKDNKLQEKIRALEAELESSRLPSASDFPSFLAKIVEREEVVSPRMNSIEKTSADARVIRAGLESFRSTDGYHLAFRPFLRRSHHLCDTLDTLTPSEQVAITLSVFCAQRSKFANEAFFRPKLAVDDHHRAIESHAIRLYDKYELGYEGSTRGGLELHILGSLVFAGDESTRKRSRGWLRVALSMYRDLLDSAPDFDSQAQLMKDYGLSLLDLDSTFAVHGGTSPFVSSEDLLLYFSISPRTTPSSSLSSELAPFLTPSYTQSDSPQDRLDESIEIVYRWVVFVARSVAEQSSVRGMYRGLSASSMSIVFSQISQIHISIATIQNHLLQPLPDQDPHRQIDRLRFLSRLNYRVDEFVYRYYNLVDAQPNGSTHDFGPNTLQSIEERIVEGLKRAAFYFRLYTVSSPHECRNLIYSVKSFPGWVRFVFETPSQFRNDHRNQLGLDLGPLLSQTELDWIEHGLEGVANYDRAVEEDLKEFRALRKEREANHPLRNPVHVDRSLTGLDFRQAIQQVSNEVAWIQ